MVLHILIHVSWPLWNPHVHVQGLCEPNLFLFRKSHDQLAGLDSLHVTGTFYILLLPSLNLIKTHVNTRRFIIFFHHNNKAEKYPSRGEMLPLCPFCVLTGLPCIVPSTLMSSPTRDLNFSRNSSPTTYITWPLFTTLYLTNRETEKILSPK